MTDRQWASELAALPVPTAPRAAQPAAVGQRRGYVYERRYEWLSYPEAAPDQRYRADPANQESEILTRPAPWWRESSVGFRAKILTNPLAGETRIAARKLTLSLSGEGTEEDFLAAIADRVSEWDFVVIDDEGNRHEVPPPKVGGWDRFLDLPNDAFLWLREEILSAHIPKAKPVAVTVAEIVPDELDDEGAGSDTPGDDAAA